jgi:hypothetical protein
MGFQGVTLCARIWMQGLKEVMQSVPHAGEYKLVAFCYLWYWLQNAFLAKAQ